jgi:hypothetical protein
MRIKGYTNMRGLFFGKHLIQRVQESHDGAGIETFRIDPRVFDERIITAINERISV